MKTSEGETLTHMETTRAVASKTTINGNDGVNDLLLSFVVCVSKSLSGFFMCCPALIVDHHSRGSLFSSWGWGEGGGLPVAVKI